MKTIVLDSRIKDRFLVTNKLRLAMAEAAHDKVTTRGDNKVYTIGNCLVDQDGFLRFGTDEEIWNNYLNRQ